MEISLKRELDEMPCDKVFNDELCHATGMEVWIEDFPSGWWNEYIDREGNLYYGR